MSRLVAAFFSVILTLLLLGMGLIGLLLLTTGGARWLADWAMELEPRLSLTVEGGALGNELFVAKLRWQDDAIQVSAEQVELAWSPECLLSVRLCLDRIALIGLQVDVPVTEPATQADESDASTADLVMERIALPLPVELRLLQLRDIQVNLPDQQVSLNSMQASASARDSMVTLEWLQADGLHVALASSADEQPAEPARPLAEFKLDLPQIELPLDLVVRRLTLENSSLQLDENRLDVRRLLLAAALRGSRLNIDRFELDAGPITAGLSGKLLLADSYPLTAQLNTRLRLPDLPSPLVVDVGADGSLQELALAIGVRDPQRLQARAKLQLLTAGLPFELAANWQQLVYPFDAEPLLALQNGQLDAHGDLAGYQGRLAVAVTGEQIPDGDWQLQFSGDAEHLRVEELNGALLAGELAAHGLLQWTDGLTWQAQLSASDLNPGVQWQDLPGQISGKIVVDGRLDEAGLAFALAVPGIEGTLLDYPLAIQGRVSKSADDHWQVEQLDVVSANNRLAIDGQLTDHWDMRASLQLDDAARLWPELQGRGSGQLTLQGLAAEPDVALELTLAELHYQDYAIQKTALDLDLRRLGLEHSSLQLDLQDLLLGEQFLDAARAELTGSRTQHDARFTINGRDIGAQLELQGALDEAFNWLGQLTSATLRLPPRQRWTLVDTVALQWRQAEQQLAVAAHCWRQRSANLCLTEDADLGQQGAVNLALSDFQLAWLAPWMPEGLQWQAPLDARVAARWQEAMPPLLRAELESRQGSVVLAQEDAEALTLSYQRLAVTASLEQQTLDAALELASEQLGAGRLVLQTTLGDEVKPLQGEVALAGLQLGLLGAFLPDIQRLEGVISANGRLDGSLQEPLFYGQIKLADGEFLAHQLPVSLTEIQLQADVSGSDARLTGGFNSGKGSAQLEGGASWSADDWRLELGLKGDKLRVIYEPLADLDVSPDLRILVQPEHVEVDGRVVIPRGKITLKELPEGSVDVSEDVVVIRRSETLADDVETPAANWRITLDLELALGDSVQIEGFGLTGQLAGELRMRQRPEGVPEADGELRIVGGRYKAYGQDLEIRRGLLLFSGPLTEPNLNIEAVRRVDPVVAGLRIEGEPEAPQVTLFSEPGLPQEEILSYLIRGRPLDSEGAGSDQLLAQAALSLGIFGGQGFASSLASELGVEDFEVGTAGEGDETQVELSGYLTPDLLVRYGIGVFEPINTLTLRYRISKNFFVEAVSGLESALDFFYQFEF